MAAGCRERAKGVEGGAPRDAGCGDFAGPGGRRPGGLVVDPGGLVVELGRLEVVPPHEAEEKEEDQEDIKAQLAALE